MNSWGGPGIPKGPVGSWGFSPVMGEIIQPQLTDIEAFPKMGRPKPLRGLFAWRLLSGPGAGDSWRKYKKAEP
jgi:hypothetical protein